MLSEASPHEIGNTLHALPTFCALVLWCFGAAPLLSVMENTLLDLICYNCYLSAYHGRCLGS